MIARTQPKTWGIQRQLVSRFLLKPKHWYLQLCLINNGILPFTKACYDLCKCWKEKGQTRKISVKQLQWLRAQNTDAQNDGVLLSSCFSWYCRHDKGNITTNMQFRTNEKNNISLCRRKTQLLHTLTNEYTLYMWK